MPAPRTHTIALCLVAGILAGLTGCKSNGVQAGGGGSSSAPLSGPPTYNEQYAARNPRICARLTTTPTPEQAKILVQCGDESLTQGDSAMLTLVTDLQVEMGNPVSYNPQVTHGSGVDPAAMSYPLRGQGTRWICDEAATGPSSAHPPAGKNCQRSAATPKGVGLCERSSFGDWQCTMTTGNGSWESGLKGPTDY